MSTKLKAGTATSGAVIDADTSGNLDLVSGSSSQYTASLPLASGTVMVSGNMPAFSAYQSSAQTLSASTLTKIQLQTEEFDTANCFDNATNYRFTPNVAGYYQVSGGLTVTVTVQWINVAVYKNGTLFKTLNNTFNSSVNGMFGSALIYFNGSTDFVELYATIASGATLSATNANTYFQAIMVRAA